VSRTLAPFSTREAFHAQHRATDYGDAPGFLATGIRRVRKVSPNIVRIDFVQPDVSNEGRREHRVTGHVDFDLDQLPAILALIGHALAELAQQPREAPDDRAGITAH
jgi:hypothetical protein